MTVPYCDKDKFAKRQNYVNWVAYVSDGNTAPGSTELEEALEDATDIMNDSDHINCKSNNITDTEYTQRLERMCYNMANRILDIERNRGIKGAFFTFSPQDFLYTRERSVLLNLGLAKGYRTIGGVSN